MGISPIQGNTYVLHTNYNNAELQKEHSKNCAIASNTMQADTVSFGAAAKKGFMKSMLNKISNFFQKKISRLAEKNAARIKAKKLKKIEAMGIFDEGDINFLKECVPSKKLDFIAPLHKKVKRPDGTGLSKNEILDIMICSDEPKLNLNSVIEAAKIVDKNGKPMLKGRDIATLHNLNLNKSDFAFAQDYAQKETSTNKDLVHIMIARKINRNFTEDLMKVKRKDGKQALDAARIQSFVENKVSPKKLPFTQQLAEIEDNGIPRFSGEEIEILSKNLDSDMFDKVIELAAKKDENGKFSYNGKNIVKQLKA